MNTLETTPEDVRALLRHNNLDFLLGEESPFEDAVNAIEEASVGNLRWDKESYLNLQPVRKFTDSFIFYRQQGALAINHLNRVWSSRAESQHHGWDTKTYLRLDAVCAKHDEEKRAATVFIPIEELKAHIHIAPEHFVNLDDPKVNEGVQKYLSEHRLRPSSFVYSHLEEKLEGNNVKCDGHYAEFVPTSTVRMIVDDVYEGKRKDAEANIILELEEQLSQHGVIKKDGESTEGLHRDLEAIFNVGENGYADLYSAFEQTRFFATILSDILRMSQSSKLSILKFFEDSGNRRRKKNNYDGANEGLRKQTIELLERIVSQNIGVPHEVFEYGVKSPESLATKVLLSRLFPTIKEGYEDGSLNEYLRVQGFKGLTDSDVRRPRDLRDLHRMAWIVHGESITYNQRTGYEAVPEQEEIALSRVYDRFFAFGEIPEYARSTKNGEPKWRHLPAKKTSDDIVINLSSRRDVKDYIADRKPNDFAQLKVYALYAGMGQETPFEIQVMTNFMDTRNRLGQDTSHTEFKRRNGAIIDYCINQGAITKGRAEAIKFVLTEALGR
jgi:hypothetical protein